MVHKIATLAVVAVTLLLPLAASEAKSGLLRKPKEPNCKAPPGNKCPPFDSDCYDVDIDKSGKGTMVHKIATLLVVALTLVLPLAKTEASHLAADECQNKPDRTPCKDGNKCTISICISGKCIPIRPIRCRKAGACKNPGKCNPKTGKCYYTNKPDESPCDDKNMCTNPDLCFSGVCKPGEPTQCEDPGPCKNPGTCNPKSGQCSRPTNIEFGTKCTVNGCAGHCDGRGSCKTGCCNPPNCRIEPCCPGFTCVTNSGRCKLDDKPKRSAPV